MVRGVVMDIKLRTIKIGKIKLAIKINFRTY